MSMILCPRCHRHLRVDEGACPFCRANLHRVGKIALATAVAITASVALLDCAYGCPPSSCGPVADAGDDAGDASDAQPTDH